MVKVRVPTFFLVAFLLAFGAFFFESPKEDASYVGGVVIEAITHAEDSLNVVKLLNVENDSREDESDEDSDDDWSLGEELLISSLVQKDIFNFTSIALFSRWLEQFVPPPEFI